MTRQRGAALLLALFVMALATMIVTGLFWRQFVLIRTIENQQLAAQSRFLLHGALDWAAAILRQQTHPTYDALSDPWAQPLAPTRLDQLGETSAPAAQATIAGRIEDAQARFNLRNLLQASGAIDPTQLGVLAKLAALLGTPGDTAALIARYVAAAYAGTAPVAVPGAASGNASLAANRPLPPVFPADLQGIPGISPAAARALAPFVIMLDQGGTPVNFNTAPPEVMAAVIPGLNIGDANAIAAERDQAYFISVADLLNRLHGRGGPFSGAGVSTNTQYFIVHGTVRLGRAVASMEALVARPPLQGPINVLWQRN